MAYKILAINPGSTSTKVAVYEDTKPIVVLTLQHTKEEIDRYAGILEQFDFRKEIIVNAVKEAGVDIEKLDAVIGRGGLTKPIKSGVYRVNADMLADLSDRSRGSIHASNLGAILANDIAKQAGCQAYIADPVVVDELQDVARVTGLPEIKRKAIFHALNQKAVARTYADGKGVKYEDLNLIVVHMGGGVSVGAHRKGEVIDVNNALEGEGPFSPDRAGGLVSVSVAEYIEKNGMTAKQFTDKVERNSGFLAYFGTNDTREITKMAEEGNAQAKLVLDAMAYNVSKYIGAMATVLKGEIDAIILTGGIAHGKYVCNYIKDMVGFMAEVAVFPGENELEALAANALRVLQGELVPKEY